MERRRTRKASKTKLKNSTKFLLYSSASWIPSRKKFYCGTHELYSQIPDFLLCLFCVVYALLTILYLKAKDKSMLYVTNYTRTIHELYTIHDQEEKKLQRPNSNYCKPLKKKIQTVVRPSRSPGQQCPPRRTKTGDFSIVFSVGSG